MDAILFVLTLEVVLLQLRIHEGSTDIRISCNPLCRRGTIQFEKLVRDRETVKDVVRRTLIEVAERSEWSTLQQAVGILEKRASSGLRKRIDHERLISTHEEIAKELITKREQWAADLRNADQKVALLHDTMKHDLLNANMRLRYAELWLNARAEALELRFQAQRRTAPLPRADHEERVHQEICKAIQLQITEREKGTEYWRMRYADDTASMNIRLAEKREQLQIAVTKRDELQELYDLHAGEMRGWLLFKAQRAARLAREERARLSATRIQAWWRGVMVRRALGAFKYLRNIKKSSAKSKKK